MRFALRRKRFPADRPVPRVSQSSGLRVRIAALFLALAFPFAAWSQETWQIPITVSAAGVERNEKMVEVELDLPDGRPLRLVEVDQTDDIVDANVPFQVDPALESSKHVLTFPLQGVTDSQAERMFRLSGGEGGPSRSRQLVSVEMVDDYHGERAFKVNTPRATYYYHVGGSGFASIIDSDGNDWISYRPEGGFQGNYRGIPNIAPPQFHPGRPEGKKRTRLIREGPLCVSLLSETENGEWRLVWDIFPFYARMTLLSKGPEPYWILYEGTPGGSFDVETDFWFNSAGERMPMKAPGQRWNDTLPAPQWVYFGDSKLRRVLFLALHEGDDWVDEFWHRGSGGMTVFGFGRGPKPQWQYLQRVPARLTIGLAESNRFAEVSARIQSAWRDVDVKVKN